MFNNKNGHTGYSSSASKFRNFQNEAYGGPFGRFTCSLLCKDIVKNVWYKITDSFDNFFFFSLFLSFLCGLHFQKDQILIIYMDRNQKHKECMGFQILDIKMNSEKTTLKQ